MLKSRKNSSYDRLEKGHVHHKTLASLALQDSRKGKAVLREHFEDERKPLISVSIEKREL